MFKLSGVSSIIIGMVTVSCLKLPSLPVALIIYETFKGPRSVYGIVVVYPVVDWVPPSSALLLTGKLTCAPAEGPRKS